MHLIGLDLGTTGVKAVVFDRDGGVCGAAYREYDVLCGEPGMAEQDAEGVWALTREVLREAVSRSGVQDVAALSASVQGDAVMPVDAAGRALHPAILGMDYRSVSQARACGDRLGAFELFQRTGMRPHPMNALPKILWLRERAPRVFEAAARIVTYADFLLGKLGGDAAIDETMASRTMAFDLHTRGWSPEVLGWCGLDPARLSRPVPSGTVVGTLAKEWAAEFGLRAPVTLVAGGHDQPCAAVGSGLVRDHLGVISTGTAEVLATAFSRPVLTRPMFESFYPCTLHAVPGMYFTFALNHTGGMLLKWFRDQCCAGERAEAAARGVPAYALLDDQMPEGPTSVFVLPHFNGSGTPTCDLNSRGAIVGLTLATTRAELTLGVLEGLTFELRTNLEAMRAAGIEIHELVAAGGGSRSARWLQLKADILNRPVHTLRCPEAACLGAALIAGTATGLYPSLEAAVRTTVARDREFVPRPDRVAAYDRRFELYRQVYPALQRLHHAL